MTFKEKEEFSFSITSVGASIQARCYHVEVHTVLRITDTYTHKGRQHAYQQKTEKDSCPGLGCPYSLW